MISNLARAIRPSATMTINAQAQALRAEGRDIISFGIGQPDFPTPVAICDAANAAMRSGKTGYTPALGVPELRDAICQKFERENGLSYDRSQVAASSGGKGMLYELLLAMLNPGDEVILFNPYWVSYTEQIQMVGGVPVVVDCDPHSLLPDFDDLSKKISPKTRGMIINSPSNPSGVVLSEALLQQLAEIARQKDLWVISDEVYEHFIYGQDFVSIATLSDDAFARTIILQSVSKTYSMTGWRLGYCASASRELIKAIGSIQGNNLGNPTSISQYAAIAALTGEQSSVSQMRTAFESRRDTMTQALAQCPALRVVVPDGAFYHFPQVTMPGVGSVDIARRLLAEANVAVVPGAAFGMDDHIRLSYALSDEDLTRGLERLVQWFVSAA